MTDKIQQARRELFEAAVARYWDERLAHFDRDGDGYMFGDIHAAWWAFNAALDCVVIELPAEIDEFADDDPGRRSFSLFTNTALRGCRTAIESTNLGIKVK